MQRGRGMIKKKKAPGASQGALENESELLGFEDRVFGGFRDLEFDDPLGRNLNLFAGGRIAPRAGGAILEFQLAEARQGERVFRVLVSQIGEFIQILDGLFFGDADLFGKQGSDL